MGEKRSEEMMRTPGEDKEIEFGKYHKQKRIENSLSLREFCERYELDAHTISRLERGKLWSEGEADMIRQCRAEGLKKQLSKISYFDREKNKQWWSIEESSTPQMTDPAFDQHGYPTEGTEEAIKTWPRKDIVGLLEFIEACWNTDYGIFEKQTGKLKLVTGGWSGNESVIYALEATYFWLRCWESSHRGGMYLFVLEEPEEVIPDNG